VAAASAVASAVFTILVFEKVVIPTQTAQLNNDISVLKKQQGIPDNTTSALMAARTKIGELESKIKSLTGQLSAIKIGNIFQPGVPYPVGLGKVKIGDPIELLVKMYPGLSVDDRFEGYVSLKEAHPQFSRVTFYFDEKAPLKKVNQMLLHMSERSLEEVIHSKLIEAFGQAAETQRRNRPSLFYWKVADITIRREEDKILLYPTPAPAPAAPPTLPRK
jgi:hypothetical protein